MPQGVANPDIKTPRQLTRKKPKPHVAPDMHIEKTSNWNNTRHPQHFMRLLLDKIQEFQVFKVSEMVKLVGTGLQGHADKGRGREVSKILAFKRPIFSTSREFWNQSFSPGGQC